MKSSNPTKKHKEKNERASKTAEAASSLQLQRRMLQSGFEIDGCFTICDIISYNEVYVVYAAKQLSDGSDVLVIEYFPEWMSQRADDSSEVRAVLSREAEFAEGVNRFEAELSVISQKDNDTLQKVLKISKANGTIYAAIEKYDGMTLSENIAAYGAVSEERLVEQLLPILLSLKLYHGAGFTHLAISPDTFRCMLNGKLILEGFGMSGAIDFRNSKLCNSPYAASELAAGINPSPASDIYSIGAVMYTALTGLSPDNARDKKGRLFYPSSLGIKVSKQTEAAILSALNLSEKDRPADLDRFIDILVGNETVVKLPPKRVEKKSKLSPIMGIIAVIIIFTLIGAALYLGYRAKESHSDNELSWNGSDDSQSVVEQPPKIKEYIETQDYTGMDAEEVISLLSQDNIGLIKTASVYSGEYDFNTVVMQYPEAGGKVYRGGNVYVVVSMGKELSKVPDVRGMEREAAMSALEAKGLSWQVECVADDDNSGCVLNQSIQAGRTVPFGTAVKITVSSDRAEIINPIGEALEILPKTEVVNIGDTAAFECGEVTKWGISNSRIADIDENGVIVAKSFGTATVFAVSEGRIAVATLTVYDPSVFMQSSITITVGQTIPISDDILESIMDDVIWSTSNESVASVDDIGNVTALKAGRTNIIARRFDEVIKNVQIDVVEQSEYIKILKATLFGNSDIAQQALRDNEIEFSVIEEYSDIYGAGSVTKLEYFGYVDNDSFYITKDTKIVIHISLGKKP